MPADFNQPRIRTGGTLGTEAALGTFGDQMLSPVAYCLRGDALESFSFKLYWDSLDYQEDCNLGKALNYLHGANPRKLDIMEVRHRECETFIVGAKEVKVEGNSQGRRILRELLELTRKGVRPEDATWFYYDHAGGKHWLFVVHAGKIVDDSYSFLDGYPLVVGQGTGWEVAESGWIGHPGFDDAFERYWFRKFYTETLAGQLMVLSHDKPPLYHFARQSEAQQKYPILSLLLTTFLIAIPMLAAIAFPLLRPYMAVAVGVFSVPWASTCWLIWRQLTRRAESE
jgi:hypothetical protein